MDDIALQKRQLEELKRDRAQLLEQLRKSQQTIERSHTLLKRIDELLAKADQKKPRS
jgi:hypothetical protein